MYEAREVPPVEIGFCTAAVGIEGCGRELKTMVTQHRAVDDIDAIVFQADEGPPCGRQKHFAS